MSVTIVQSGFDDYADAAATAQVTLPGVASGNTLICVSMLYDLNTGPTASVSDGTALTLAIRSAIDTGTGGSSTASIHYRHNVTSGSHTVVCTTTAPAGKRYGWIWVAEVSGLVNVAPNRTATNSGTSTTPTSGTTAATTVSDTWVLSVLAIGDDTANPASIDVPATTGYANQFVRQDVIAEMGGSVDSKSVSATGAQSAAWGTLAGSLHWSAAIAAFEITSAAAATLSSATPSGTLGTTSSATLGATTDITSGTFYGVVDTAGNISGITAAQVKAGQNNVSATAIASSNSVVSTTTPSTGVGGLTAATLYSYAVVQNSSGGDSNVLTGTFTTATASATLQRLMLLGVG